MDNNEVFVKLENVKLTFPLYSNRDPSIKSNVINIFTKKDNKNNEKTYLKALDDVSLTVNEKETVGIIGRNGAGKSTLLRVIANIYEPDEGKLNVKGKVIPLMTTGIGFNENLDAVENIKVAGLIMGLDKSEIPGIIDNILDFTELNDFAYLPIKYYSVGMKMRLSFAVATEVNPEILLLDEVFSGGDMHWMEKANERMSSIINKAKILIVCSHSLSEISKYCERTLWVSNGKIKLDGETQYVINEYKKSK